ncbi:hypothetical protein [Flammeovirga aprica]|uniref:Lipoprotein n=1 Tax=Flammeovirga aprica JL-4 TaxID=694437 RepID=A0A7X9RWZ8_9BACT|nr:hypothetical protein [Flammeovirga aprica]NME70266.1 hypothetical protein [Flammeovirga aprica JL-4]
MQKLYCLVLVLLFSSCLNQKTGERDESLLIFSSEGNYLSKNLENYGNNYLITGVMNEASAVSSIDFLDVNTWKVGQGYIAILNDLGEPIAQYLDERTGSIYASLDYIEDDFYIGGTFEKEFLLIKFLKEGNTFKKVIEKKWTNDFFKEGVINLVKKVGDQIIVVGRGKVNDGSERFYFAALTDEGEIVWENVHNRASQYHLPKDIKEENGQVKVLTWEINEFEGRQEISEYTIDLNIGLVDGINFLSVDGYRFSDAAWLNGGIIGLAKVEEGKDKLFWLTDSEEKEVVFDYQGEELKDLIGKDNYFIVSSPLEGSEEIKYHNITINRSGDVISHVEFINSIESRLIGVEYLADDDQYFTMTSSLLKFKYVLEFRKN